MTFEYTVDVNLQPFSYPPTELSLASPQHRVNLADVLVRPGGSPVSPDMGYTSWWFPSSSCIISEFLDLDQARFRSAPPYHFIAYDCIYFLSIAYFMQFLRMRNVWTSGFKWESYQGLSRTNGDVHLGIQSFLVYIYIHGGLPRNEVGTRRNKGHL